MRCSAANVSIFEVDIIGLLHQLIYWLNIAIHLHIIMIYVCANSSDRIVHFRVTFYYAIGKGLGSSRNAKISKIYLTERSN